MLLNNGADLKVKDRSEGNTVLHLLTSEHTFYQKPCANMFNLLLDNGADINAQNNYGNTALLIACGTGDIEIAQVLINRGADTIIQNVYGRTALQRVEGQINVFEKRLATLSWSINEKPAVAKKLEDYKSIRVLLLNEIFEK